MSMRRQKALQARQVAAQRVRSRKGSAALRRTQSPMLGASGARSGFQKPAGGFASATGTPKKKVVGTAVNKLTPFI